MCEPTTVGLIIAGTSVVATTSTTAYQMRSAGQARDEAQNKASKAEYEQAAAIKEAKEKEEADMAAFKAEEAAAEKKADTAAMNLALRKKRNAIATSSRSGTILTSPLGLTGTAPQTSGKTLLGA